MPSTLWTVHHAVLCGWASLFPEPCRAWVFSRRSFPDVAWSVLAHGRQGPEEGRAGLVSGQSALPWLQVQLKEASGNRHGAQHRASEPCVWKLTLYLENWQRRA